MRCELLNLLVTVPSSKVYIVVLNYNGWTDTIECLESLAKLTFYRYQIIVVDNFSDNDSISHIQAWADGRQPVVLAEDNALLFLSHPAVSKPIPYKLYSRKEAESGGDGLDDNKLILIQTGENIGFAGGNNVALRYVLKRADADYVWLLNNDTVVEPRSLSELIECYAGRESERIGIVGGKIRYYHNPGLIQCIAGAYYNKWLGYSRQIGNREPDKGQYDIKPLHPNLIIGACMLVSTHFLTEVGLLDESYFLYFEEQDWAERAKRMSFSLQYSTEAIIYHKEGGTIGANQWQGNSRFSDFYFTRSKLLFTERYFGKLTRLTVKLSLLFTILNRVRRRQFDRVAMLISIMKDPRGVQFTEK